MNPKTIIVMYYIMRTGYFIITTGAFSFGRLQPKNCLAKSSI